MHIFVNLEKIISFFAKYNIDITLFTEFEQAILIILANILILLFYGFAFYICYKLIFKILSWWF